MRLVGDEDARTPDRKFGEEIAILHLEPEHFDRTECFLVEGNGCLAIADAQVWHDLGGHRSGCIHARYLLVCGN